MLNDSGVVVPLSTAALRYDTYSAPSIPNIPAMITPSEQQFLACAAERMWSLGAVQDGLIIDAGCYLGASTVALAVGLERSGLSHSDQCERIWSYDKFVATPVMANVHLSKFGVVAGDSFRGLFDANLANWRHVVRVCDGDIRTSGAPDRPIALLFVDLLWSWEVTEFLQQNFYSRLSAGRSLLIQQDFIYPYYPWVILSMGLLEDVFCFSKHVQFSSAVFDVTRQYRSASACDARDIPLQRAVAIYDRFIDAVEGWARGALGLGKALYLASRNELQVADALVGAVEMKFHDEALVMQYIPSIRQYIDDAQQSGTPVPLDAVSGQ